MSMLEDGCERCGDRVARQGDHLCTPCADWLGRAPAQPFWGAFAAHPVSKLNMKGAARG